MKLVNCIKLITFISVFALVATSPAIAKKATQSESNVEANTGLDEKRISKKSAAGSKPSPVDELISLLGVEQQTKESLTQISLAIQKSAAGIARNVAPSKRLDQIISRYHSKVFAEYQKLYSWESQQPLVRKAYMDSMTPSEIKDVVEFYRSSAGSKFIAAQEIVGNSIQSNIEVNRSALDSTLSNLRQQYISQLSSHVENQVKEKTRE